MKTRPALIGGEWLLVLVALCGLVMVTLWPWPLYFQSGFPDHFDPPFHAWKLQVDADKVLAGQVVPDPLTNIYYPYANELYFDALLWPQGMVAAGLKLLGCGPILTYNLVLLFFWGLSGLFMYLLLREMGLRRPAAFFGGVAFCLIPYRTSYYVEFNMQMCFGLPLFLLFWLRFSKRPSPGAALGMAVAVWLQAISELYQVVILALAFPLILLPGLGPLLGKHGRTPRLYLLSGLALVIVLALCLPYLAPYLSLFHEGYGRGSREMMAHSLEPLAYLGGWLVELIFSPSVYKVVKTDEMNVFPSLALVLLALAAGWRFRKIGRPGPGAGEPAWLRLIRWSRAVALVIFCVLIMALVHTPSGSAAEHGLTVLGNLTLLLALAATVTIGLTAPGRAPSRVLVAGLAGAALFCFILSLGPSLRVLTDCHQAENWLFTGVSRIFPLTGFRVMSRFSILVMIFLVVQGARMLDALNAGRRPVAVALALALLLAEAHVSGRSNESTFRYTRFPLRVSSRVQEVLDRSRDHSLLVVPLGDRSLDSGYMLAIGKTRNLLVNGFGGFIPSLQIKLGRCLASKPERAMELAGAVWPPPLVILDRKAVDPLAARGYRTTENFLTRHGIPLVRGPRFTVFQLREPTGPLVEYRRFLRADMLRANQEYRFWAKSLDGQRPGDLFVNYNGLVVASFPLTSTWQQFNIPLPPAGIAGIDYEMVLVRASQPGNWTAKGGTFGPVPQPVQPDRQRILAANARLLHTVGYPDWLYAVPELPPGVPPLDLAVADDLILAGLDLSVGRIRPGQELSLRFFWRLPAGSPPPRLRFQVEFIPRGGSSFTALLNPLHGQPASFLVSRPVDKLFFQQQRVRLPPNLAPGPCELRFYTVDQKNNRIRLGGDHPLALPSLTIVP